MIFEYSPDLIGTNESYWSFEMVIDSFKAFLGGLSCPLWVNNVLLFVYEVLRDIDPGVCFP